MKHKKKIFIIIILFAVLVGFRYYLDKPYLKIINPKVESIFDEPVNMAAFLFGESRKTLAAILWQRILIYHTESSHASRGFLRGDYRDFKITENVLYCLKDKVDTKSLITLKDKVFSRKELVGELKKLKFNSKEQRLILDEAMMPTDNYMKEGTQILPILRLITWLDNHFIMAYDFGGYFLAVNQEKPKEGINFLKEGIQHNPDNYDLNQGLAYIYLLYVKDYKQAIKYGKLALKNAIKLKVTSEDIKSLKGKLPEDKINFLSSLESMKFSREALKEILRKKEFTEKEINEVIKYVTYEYDENVKMDCVNSLRIIGHSYRKAGDMKNAKKYYNMIQEIDPELDFLVRALLRMKPKD